MLELGKLWCCKVTCFVYKLAAFVGQRSTVIVHPRHMMQHYFLEKNGGTVRQQSDPIGIYVFSWSFHCGNWEVLASLGPVLCLSHENTTLAADPLRDFSPDFLAALRGAPKRGPWPHWRPNWRWDWRLSSGWWFGTWLDYDFPYLRNNTPIWLLYFSEG